MNFALGQNKLVAEAESGLLNRAKRLSIALYRLTSYFEPNEPMRESLRAKAISLMDTVLVIKDIRKPLKELLSYTDVLLYSGLVSETNIKILKDELMSLTNQAQQLTSEEPSPFFGLTDLIPDLPKTLVPPSNHLIGLNLATAQLATSSQKDKRLVAIVDFIRKNGGANVRDLMAVVRGCSEKTIQRELALLIAHGELKREGERRWSKYLLARAS